MSDLQYTPDELDALEAMVTSDGWRVLERDARQEIYELQATALEATRSHDETMYLRGQAAQIAAFLNLPAVVENYRTALEAGDE